MKLRNRDTLKRNFSKGRLLSESDFADLINSTVNKVDDGFSKDNKNGLQLSPSLESNKVLSVFNKITDQVPLWHLSLEKENERRVLSIHGPESDKYISFHENGNIGVNTQTPSTDFEVDGMIASKGRLGYYEKGQKDSNGHWHTILKGKEEHFIEIYEVVAYIKGAKGKPHHAALYAIAMRVLDKTKINKTRVNKGWIFHRLNLRWKKDKQGIWNLQIKTSRKYAKMDNGQYPLIHFYISKLNAS